MKLAVITCQELPHGAKQDQPLYAALEQLNVDFEIHAWDAAVD